ncbi:hypothetical protein AB0L25_18555 [Spirillospora sp. NPDC052242]
MVRSVKMVASRLAHVPEKPVETGETSTQPVLGTITGKGDKNLVRITVADDAPSLRFAMVEKTGASQALIEESNTGVIIATDNHPFYCFRVVDVMPVTPIMYLRPA